MDQMIALAAEQGHAMMLDCRSFEFRHVRLDLAAAGLVLLVIDTRARHALVEGSYGDRRKTCQEAATLLNVSSLRDIEPGELARVYAELEDHEMLRRVRHVVTEIERVRESVVALEAGRLADLGPLLDASHESLRDDYEVSWPEADLACHAARAAGALGARMTGGGFGGTVIALVTQAEMDEVTLAVDAAFRAARHELPAFLLATPGGAAARADSA
jgi:galactokinase